MTRRRRPELWTSVPCLPKVAVREAERAEREGWDGILLADSQNLGSDVFVELAMCAANTDRVRLGPGVTNPVTRHPAVMASAAATLQAESAGRFVLGIGRGDSALAYLGYAPASVDYFEGYIQALQGYLRGEEIAFSRKWGSEALKPVAELELGTEPPGSALRWLRADQPKVPVDIAATGPRMIDLATTAGDSVTFSVGANPERVGWAVDRARRARSDGEERVPLRLGAYINMAVHDDVAVARRLISGGLASFSRFSVMHGTVTAAAQAADQGVLTALHDAYDMTNHGYAGASHLQVLEGDFIDRNGVVGSASTCLERLRSLWELGIERFVIMTLPAREPDAAEAHAALVDEVLPAVAEW